MKDRILFHTPQPLEDLDSGSSVRPAKMIEAFEQLNYTVETIIGNAEERRDKIRDLRQNESEYRFCYSEPTTWPLNPLVDYQLYWYLWKKDIPTGIFYRDIYWQFPKLFDHSGLKYWELQARYRLDLSVISRIGDCIYVPSSSFGEQLSLKSSTTPLPPGGIDRTETNKSTSQLRRVIYVGGVSKKYGTELLSKSLETAAENQNITLILICREAEFQSLPKTVRDRFDSDWAEIHHVHGEELHSLYQFADAGIIPIQPTTYNNISMPVKLFEYLSYGLPVITTNVDEVASFVQSSDCGIVCKANYEHLAQALTELSTDEKLYQRKKENAIQTLKQNRWIDRADQVASDLIDGGSPNDNF
ncbi:glycosyltransferase [Haloplanus rubicundus]|uniref:Glycosyltransferase n=1 Tax=Haloplanus rubicundus TaxID=1547898 RepID=A0A345EBY1_9EURY|nr:glycosyltransferase [Haloplanus rubicundus]AXG09703.1 glycosyltransferase [Haloplanus rubicundus]